MTKYATGNPVGSSDPRDLYDNAQNLDEAVNNTAAEWTDRLGRRRPTIAGAIDPTGLAQAAADEADRSEAEANRSTNEADRSETAANNSLLNADLYDDTAAGIAGTAEGEQFQVLSVSGDEYIRYKHDAGDVAVAVGRYPAQSSVENLQRYTLENSTDISQLGGKFVESLGGSDALLSDEPAGLSIDFTAERVEDQVTYVDPANSANNYKGSALDFFPQIFVSGPSRVTKKDGTQGWSNHDLIADNHDLTTAAWTAVAVSTESASGGTKLVNTGSGARIYQTYSTGRRSGTMTANVVLKKGEGDWVAVSLTNDSDKTAWFDLSSLSVGTTGADITSASVVDYEVGGVPLPSGFYRLEVVGRKESAGASELFMFRNVSTDGDMTSVNVGDFCIVARAALNFGMVSCPVTVTGADAAIHPPVDYSSGEGALLTYGKARTSSSLYGYDLTNPVWTLTGGTAALDAQFGDVEVCSSFTATSPNATVMQDVTDATASQFVSLYIKRRAGSGGVHLTTNGGATWTDISGQVTSDFTRVAQPHSGANPSIGLKLEVSGDSVEVAEFHQVNQGALAPSMPTYGSNGILLPDTAILSLPSALVSSELTAYSELVSPVFSGQPDASIVINDSSGVDSITLSPSAGYVRAIIKKDGETHSPILADSELGGTTGFYVRLDSTSAWVGVGGTSPHKLTIDSPFNIDEIGLRTASTSLTKRFLIVPRAVPLNEVREWRVRPENKPAFLLGDEIVSAYGETGSNVREPAICVTSDRPEKAEGFISVGERSFTVNSESGEMPSRQVLTPFEFNKNTQKLIVHRDRSYVNIEPPQWVNGFGHIQSTVAVKQKFGANKWRIHMIYSQLDTANGSYQPIDNRPIYYIYSDGNGEQGTWSTPVKILDKGDGGYSLGAPSGDAVVFPPDSPHAGKILFPYYGFGVVGVLILDTDTQTWTEGGTVPMGTANEPSISLRPNGDVIMTIRDEDTGGTGKVWTVSTDGGLTFSAKQSLAGDYWAVSSSQAETDTEGDYGPMGRMIFVSPEDSGFSRRDNLTVRVIGGENLSELGVPLKPWGVRRVAGYVSARYLSGGYLLVATENPLRTGANSNNTIKLLALDVSEGLEL